MAAPLLCLAILAPPAPSAAQVSLGASVSLATPYTWRGVTRSNGWNFQPETFLGLGLAGGYLTTGAWANLEAGAAGPGNLSDLGSTRPGWSEVDYWLQYARPVGQLDATLGAIHYTFPGDAAGARRTSADNTTELYASLQLPSTYLVPRLTAWLDLDRVRGTYLEADVTVPLLAYPFGNPVVFYAGLLAGLNLGQDANPDRPAQRANFRHDGLTHLDFSVRATVRPVKSLPVWMNLEPHWEFKIDEATRRTSPEPGDAERRLQFRLLVSLATTVPIIPGGAP